MNFRQLISFSLAILLGLTSANAYIPKNLGGEGTPGEKTALQVETAVLLREDGTPRCFIGKRPSEYLTAEKLDEFYRQGEIGPAALDTLRECDDGDELYAISVLGNEEISLGMAVPPVGKVWLVSGVIGGATGCVLMVFDKWLSSKDLGLAMRMGQVLITFAGGTGGILVSPLIVSEAVIPVAMVGGFIASLFGGIFISIVGAGFGMTTCDNLYSGQQN